MTAQTWVTVQQGTVVAHRSKTVVYGWISRGIVRSRRRPDGVLEVHGLDLLNAEAKVKNGRPKGQPTRRN